MTAYTERNVAMTVLEKMCEAYWNAGITVARWADETEDQRETVRTRMKSAMEALCEALADDDAPQP